MRRSKLMLFLQREQNVTPEREREREENYQETLDGGREKFLWEMGVVIIPPPPFTPPAASVAYRTNQLLGFGV